MNPNRIVGEMKQIIGKLQSFCGDMLEVPTLMASGRRRYLAGMIQERYGIAKDLAERRKRDFVHSH